MVRRADSVGCAVRTGRTFTAARARATSSARWPASRRRRSDQRTDPRCTAARSSCRDRRTRWACSAAFIRMKNTVKARAVSRAVSGARDRVCASSASRSGAPGTPRRRARLPRRRSSTARKVSSPASRRTTRPSVAASQRTSWRSGASWGRATGGGSGMPAATCVVVIAGSGSRRDDTRDSDVIEPGELALEVHVALELDAALIGATAAGGALAVSPIQRIHNVHTLDDLAQRGESHAVELAVVAVIDEELRGTRAGPRRRKAHRTAGIGLTHRVVRNRGVAPGRSHLRIAVDAEVGKISCAAPRRWPRLRGAPSAGSLSGVRVPKRLTPHVHSLVDDEKRYRAGGAGVPPQLLDGRASARTGTRVDVRSLCEARTGESGHHAESHLHIPLAAR